MSCAENLNKNLKAALALHINFKSSHWNLRGKEFIAVHKLFDEAQEAALDWADTMAEQLGYMDKEAEATAKLIGTSYIGPHKVGVAPVQSHIRAALSQLEKFESEMKKALDEALDEGEQVIADVFIEISRGVAKYIYLIGSHLK